MKIRLQQPLGIYEIGKRVKQEDAIFPQLETVTASNRVFVVCDGLGGLDNGEVASSVVASTMGESVERYLTTGEPLTREKVNEAVINTHHALEAAATHYESEKSMGTTLTMLALASNGVVAAHIGDSRIYHLRPATGQVMYRSRDHSLVNDLFLMGRLTRAEAEASPKRNILTRAMLPGRPVRADIVFIADVKPGDYFILCSDGVCGEISDKKLMSILADESKTNAQKLAEIQMIIQDGADNRSAFLLQVAAVEKEESDNTLVGTEGAMCDKMVKATTASAAASAAVASTASDGSDECEDAVPPVLTSCDDSQVPPPVPRVQASAEEVALEAPLAETPPPIADDQVQPEEKKEDAKEVYAENKNGLNKAMWILLAAVLLAAGITACFMLRKPATPVVTAQKPDTLINPDVTIDSVLPEAPPIDSMAIGTDVPVPPAPRINSVPTPDVAYPSGSSVRVPRATGRDSYPTAFDEVEDEDAEYIPPTPTEQNEPSASRQEPSAPKQPAAVPSPPARPKASADPSRSNRNVSVPPPPGKRSVTQAPY